MIRLSSVEEIRNMPLPEFINLFQQFDFDKQLNDKAYKIVIAIITKWDKVLRPSCFKMGNKELADIARLDAQKGHIGRNRTLAVNRCIANTIPVFSYTSQGQSSLGIYKVNTYSFIYTVPDQIPLATKSQAPDPPLITKLRKLETEKRPYRRYTSQELKNWEYLKAVLLEEMSGCEACRSKARLELHHKTYINWGNETRDDVVLLCRKCHRKVHTGGDANG